MKKGKICVTVKWGKMCNSEIGKISNSEIGKICVSEIGKNM